MTHTLADQIYDRAAADLAAMREPDLRQFADVDVDVAMSQAFTMNGPRPEWLADLRRRVDRYSGSLVSLEDADPSEFPYQVKSMAVAYQRLSGLSGRRQLLVMGPFQPPFQFMGDG